MPSQPNIVTRAPVRRIDYNKLAEVLYGADQKRIDRIISRAGIRVILEAAREMTFPHSFEIEDRIRYAVKYYRTYAPHI